MKECPSNDEGIFVGPIMKNKCQWPSCLCAINRNNSRLTSTDLDFLKIKGAGDQYLQSRWISLY